MQILSLTQKRKSWQIVGNLKIPQGDFKPYNEHNKIKTMPSVASRSESRYNTIWFISHSPRGFSELIYN